MSLTKGETQGINVVVLILLSSLYIGIGWFTITRSQPESWMKWFIVVWSIYNLLVAIFRVTRDMVNGE